MEFLAEIKSLCNALGFTLDKVSPLILLGVVIVIVIFRREKNFNSSIAQVNKRIENVESYLYTLCGALKTNGDLQELGTFKSHSPNQITEEGYQILEKIGFKQDIDAHYDLLEKAILRTSPKSAYDVERVCVGIASFTISENDVHIFKTSEDFLYQNPEYNKNEYFITAGLYLRDKFLEKHPDLIPKK